MAELARFVAAVLDDKSKNDLLEENEIHRKQLTEARKALRKVEIATRDGTIFAEGSLEGATPITMECPGLIRVNMTMIEGARACQKADLLSLIVRIAGIPAYDLSNGRGANEGVNMHDITTLFDVGLADRYEIFLPWSTRLLVGLLLSFPAWPEVYPLEIDDQKLEIDGISLSVGPRIPGRSAVNEAGDFALEDKDIGQVIFRNVIFNAYVGSQSRTMSAHLFSM